MKPTDQTQINGMELHYNGTLTMSVQQKRKFYD